MALFTFLMEFRGGTYLAQVQAKSPRAALRKWLHSLDAGPIAGMGPRTKREFLRWLPEAGPTPISGLSRTWCASFVSRSGLALIHFVQTEGRS